MTVQELIDQLGKFDRGAEVACTWEGTINEIEVYQAADSTILIDGDSSSYKIRYQKIKCKTCGKQAVHAPFNNQPICYEHWYDFKEK